MVFGLVLKKNENFTLIFGMLLVRTIWRNCLFLEQEQPAAPFAWSKISQQCLRFHQCSSSMARVVLGFIGKQVWLCWLVMPNLSVLTKADDVSAYNYLVNLFINSHIDCNSNVMYDINLLKQKLINLLLMFTLDVANYPDRGNQVNWLHIVLWVFNYYFGDIIYSLSECLLTQMATSFLNFKITTLSKFFLNFNIVLGCYGCVSSTYSTSVSSFCVSKT